MNSEQLELELDDVRVRIPWDGVSPRMLTKCGKLFSLKAAPARGSIGNAPDQLTMFLKGTP